MATQQKILLLDDDQPMLDLYQELLKQLPSTPEVRVSDAGARAIAMGEAYTAQADDASSLYWNPAGLALMRERQASFMYDQMYQGMSFQNANVGIPLENGAIRSITLIPVSKISVLVDCSAKLGAGL